VRNGMESSAEHPRRPALELHPNSSRQIKERIFIYFLS
jgi:hypothetical protein